MTVSGASNAVVSGAPSRRRVARVLLVALLGFIALLSWAFGSPVGASPDDNFHQVSIWCATGERPGLCETTGDPNERSVRADLAYSSACYAFAPEHSGVCDPALTGMIVTGHGNFIGMYPPVYYSVMSVFASNDLQTSVLLIRAFNSLLAVSIVTALYLLVGRELGAPLLWSLLVTAIPMGIFLTASVNPNGWAIVSAATMWVAMVGFFRAPTLSRRIALGGIALVTALMGAGSRGDSAAYVAVGAVVAAIVAFERTRRYLFSLLLPLFAVGMGAVFYLGSTQTGTAIEGQMPGAPTHEVDFLRDFFDTVINIPRLWIGNFGTQSLGWGDVEMPAMVWVTTMAVCVGVAFWSLSRSRDARTNIAIALTGTALVLVPSWVITQNGVDVGELVQPRYVLPLQVLFIGLLLYGAGDPRSAMTRVQRWLIVIGLSVANSVALYTTMRRYLTGTDYRGFDLNKNMEWWWQNMPIPPGTIWILGSAAFTGMLLLVSGILTRRPHAAQKNSALPAEEQTTTN
ncbi:DUF2142 domain-containing protein [Microbacterium sp. A204]|uniref:DUF2142 domain-containing protein n=1 Tax=Microbacterium sp. A204 TaxID=3457321 RepID=UPI003FD4852B